MYKVKVFNGWKTVTITSDRPIKQLTKDELIANAKKSDSKIIFDFYGNVLQATCRCGSVFFPNELCQCFGKVDRKYQKGYSKREKYRRKGRGQRTLNLEKIYTTMGRII